MCFGLRADDLLAVIMTMFGFQQSQVHYTCLLARESLLHLPLLSNTVMQHRLQMGQWLYCKYAYLMNTMLMLMQRWKQPNAVSRT